MTWMLNLKKKIIISRSFGGKVIEVRPSIERTTKDFVLRRTALIGSAAHFRMFIVAVCEPLGTSLSLSVEEVEVHTLE